MKKGFGHAFSEEVKKVSNTSGFSKIKQDPMEWKDGLIANFGNSSSSLMSNWRSVVLLSVFLISFAALFIRIFHLQVVQGQEWRSLADSNRIKIKIIHAPRGVIYDRNGKILAQNDPGFRLNIVGTNPNKAEYISRDEALKMEVGNDPRLADLEIDSQRSYPLGEQAAHILGYMGEITDAELKLPQFSKYKPGDSIGRGGVEQIYESTLRGVDGGEIIEVDSQGKPIRTLRKIDPIPGQNLYLTIDADLQKQTFQALADGVKKVKSCCGAAVVSDPKSGQILALVSYPSFDPKNISISLTDPNSPLLDRAISGEYPPGSTFKIASSLAGLSSGKITTKTQVLDTGVIQLGPYSFSNWYFSEYGKTEGVVDILKAIQRSNDIFFYSLGETVGEQTLSETARKLGLGKILGIDLPGEESGLIPDDAWKERVFHQVWYPGDTLHMAIGQGYVLVTPLQILNLISVVAADGRSYPPHLSMKITSPTGKPIKQFSFDSYSTPAFSTTDLTLVKTGLELVPKQGGTAWPFFTYTIPTAGKTGTAEFGDPNNRTHAWYTSYAPSDNPKIASTILVEGGGEGSNVSAPIAKSIYSWYFSPDKAHPQSFEYIPVATESAKVLGE